MSLNDRQGGAASLDAAFERSLLDSAHVDAPSDAATQAAWARFAATAVGTAASTAAVRQGMLVEAVRSSALKWLLLGALGGSAVTAAWMHGVQTADRPSLAQVEPSPTVAPRTAAQRELPPREVAVPAGDSAGALPPLIEVTDMAVSDGSSALGLANQATVAVRSRRAPDPTPVPAARSRAHLSATEASPHAALEPSSTPTSTLDAEVAALDAVRAAISAAAFHRALRLIEQYRQDFPAGELARDADVFEIETLTAQGDRAEATRQADRFLARYPNDPHLARLRGLVGR